jgi:hypothetical protein
MSLFLFPLIGFVVAELFVVYVLRSGTFTVARAFFSSVGALLLLLIAASIIGYFCVRVRINDHYEFNLALLRILFLYPAGIGALVGAAVGVFMSARRGRTSDNV